MLVSVWSEYQIQFQVLYQTHTVARTVMPAETRHRYNLEMTAISSAKLAVRESALTAAKGMLDDLELQLTSDALTGHSTTFTEMHELDVLYILTEMHELDVFYILTR